MCLGQQSKGLGDIVAKLAYERSEHDWVTASHVVAVVLGHADGRTSKHLMVTESQARGTL